MNSISIRWILTVALILAGAFSVHAGWDTHLQVVKTPPTVAHFPAQAIRSVDMKLVDDAQSSTGKAVLLAPGQGRLAFEQELPVGEYVLHLVLRSEKPQPRGRIVITPVTLQLRVTDTATGQEQKWRTRVASHEVYYDTGHLYFSIHKPGTYRVEVESTGQSKTSVLVDHVDLKNVLGNLPGVAEKKSQNLLTDQQLAFIRKLPASMKEAQTLSSAQALAGLSQMDDQRAQAWREATFNIMWDILPPENMHFGSPRLEPHFQQWINDEAYDYKGARQWALKVAFKPRSFEKRAFVLPADISPASLSRLSVGPWQFEHPHSKARYGLEQYLAGEVAGDCAIPDDGTGFILEARKIGGPKPMLINWMGSDLMQQYRDLPRLAMVRAGSYQNTANTIVGWEGVCALVTYVYRLPRIDYQTQRFEFDSSPFGQGYSANYNPFGKFGNSGQEAWIEQLIVAYDQLFPLIKDNQQLADLLGQKIEWIKTPEDVIRLLDVYLLQHVRDCIDRQVIRGNDGVQERILATAAVVQGPGQASQWMWDLIFSRVNIRMHHKGGLQDHLVSMLSTDGTVLTGSLNNSTSPALTISEIMALARRYVELGGELKVPLHDVKQFPQITQAAATTLDMLVAGGFLPRIGDSSGQPDDAIDDRRKMLARYKPLFHHAWLATGDSAMAWYTRMLGRTNEPDDLWQAIEAAASSLQVDPVLAARSRVLPGFGLAVLETNPRQTDYLQKQALVMRTGSAGEPGSHADALALTYYSQGIRLIPDTGRRGTPPDARSTRVHHTVEVDEASFSSSPGRGALGWTQSLADMHGAGYTQASAWSASQPQVNVYRRQAMLIPTGNQGAYVVDLFRVEGGSVHTWTTPGPVNTEASQITINTNLSDRLTDLLKRYPGTENYEKKLQAPMPSMLEATWRVPGDIVRRSQNVPRNASPPSVALRLWMPGEPDDALIQAYGSVGDSSTRRYAFNFLHVRRQSREANQPLSSSFLSVLNGYADDQPAVIRVEELPVAGGKRTALSPRAMRIETRIGREDTILLGQADSSETLTLPGGGSLQGEVALISRDKNRLVQLAAAGSQKVSADDVTLAAPAGRWQARVVAVDLQTSTLTLDQAWPQGALGDQVITVIRQGKAHHLAMRIADIQGQQLRTREPLAVYQSAVESFDSATGQIVPEMPLPLLDQQHDYYDGLALFNEAGRLVGRTRVIRGDRVMYLGYPEAWRQKQTLTAADLAKNDAGRVVFKLIARQTARRVRGLLPDGKADVYPLDQGETMAELEVTRVSDDGLMFWFKNPQVQYADTSNVVNESQPYVGQILQTASGRQITANWPGTEYRLTLEQGALTAESLPDADNDGRKVLRISHVAPGDTVELTTFFSAQRLTDNRWNVRANTPLTFQVGGASANIPLTKELVSMGVNVVISGGQPAVESSGR